MRADLLAAAVADDRRAGRLPLAVVATRGRPQVASVDPVRPSRTSGARERLWLHVDAAYAGTAAILPGAPRGHRRDGARRLLRREPSQVDVHAFDLSAFYCRRMDLLRAAFALTPEYLRTSEARRCAISWTRVPARPAVPRPQAVIVMRSFGSRGIRARLREHVRLARLFASWVDADPGFERVAPVSFGVVCFRAVPGRARGRVPEPLQRASPPGTERHRRGVLSHTSLGVVTSSASRSGTSAPPRPRSAAPGPAEPDGALDLIIQVGRRMFLTIPNLAPMTIFLSIPGGLLDKEMDQFSRLINLEIRNRSGTCGRRLE